MAVSTADIAVRMLNEGKDVEAEAYCQQQLASSPDDAMMVQLMALLRLRQNRLNEALPYLLRGITLLPTWSDGYFVAGKLLHEVVGNHEEAAKLLRRAIELAPNDADRYFALAQTLPYSGRMDDGAESRELFAKAVELRPDWAEAWTQLGNAWISTGHPADGEAALRRSLELRPGNLQTLVILSTALLEQDKPAEALGVAEQALAVAPNDPGLLAERNRLADIARSRAKPERLARYPRAVKEFDDLRTLIDKYILSDFKQRYPIISPTTKVFAMGSCFAINLATTLQRRGFPAEAVNYPDQINSTFENRYLLEWVVNGPSERTRGFQQEFGDAYRQKLIGLIQSSNVAILSLGVGACFFDKETGEFVSTFGMNFHTALLLSKFVFKTTTVSQNVENLRFIVDALRQINPKIHLVLTVSPVPLKATFERGSAMIADCVSKSTLRVVAHEFMQLEIPDTYYWPSYEMVRWIGGHTTVFGADDGSPLHVNQAMIDLIIDRFISIFGSAEMQAANAPAV